MTDKDKIEALSAKCALLSASLHKAEQERAEALKILATLAKFVRVDVPTHYRGMAMLDALDRADKVVKDSGVVL